MNKKLPKLRDHRTTILSAIIFTIGLACAVNVFQAIRTPTLLGSWECTTPVPHPDGRTEDVTLRYEFRGSPFLPSGEGAFDARQLHKPFAWRSLPDGGIVMDFAGDGWPKAAHLTLSPDGNHLQITGNQVFPGSYTRKR